MKNDNISLLLQVVFTPIMLMILGFVLVFHPDFASAMIARVLGWAIILVGVGSVAIALLSHQDAVGKGIVAVICALVGGWLLKNPLKLAAAIGRVVGILLTLRGVQDIRNAIQWRCGMTFALLSAAVGVLLIVLPMTTSRIVMTLLGFVVILLGIAMLLDRLKLRGRIKNSSGDDDEIIDV